jgi:glycosyltransferase involved in cell wall biosynthesis
VFYVGRFEERKGFDIALDVAHRVLAADSECEFWFAGGRLDIGATQLVSGLGFDDLLSNPRFHVLGILSRSELERCYRDCDVVLMPSRYESFGLVVIEAMAAGKPPIVLDVGGPRDIVVNRVNGLLAPADASAADVIATEIVRLGNDPSILRELARGARQTYLERFTVDEMVKGLEAVFYRHVNRVEPA